MESSNRTTLTRFLFTAALAAATMPLWAQSPPGAAGVDLRPAFTAAGLAPRSQGARGTCSVLTLTGAIEFALTRAGDERGALSPEFLSWATWKTVGRRRDGGFLSELWRGYDALGICAYEAMPYTEKLDRDRQPSESALADAATRRDAGLRLHWIKPWNVRTGLTDAHVAEIKRVLRAGWPVCCGLRWPKPESWTDDVLDWAPPEGVYDGHSVLFVGYRDDPAQPGGGVFLIHNTYTKYDGPLVGALSYAYAQAYTNDAAWVGFDEAGPLDLSLLSPLGEPVAGRNHRASSNASPRDDAGVDTGWLLPGESVDLPVLRGPGVINHVRLTSHAGRAGELDALVLRIWWDGRMRPGVEVPVGDFFAVGQGEPAAVESVPVQVSPSGSLTCFWRMPFRESARIVITNDDPERSTGLDWQVDWVAVEELPPRTPYFHAGFDRDGTVAELAGRGCYVGTVHSVTLARDGRPGAGDVSFWIDGEEEPSLRGAGAEDDFEDARGSCPRTGPWCGQPRWQGEAAGDSGVAYRWHLPDPIFFERSLRFAREHAGPPDFVRGVAFWYQLGEPAPWPELPPLHERRVPWQQHHLVAAYRHAEVSGGAGVAVETQGLFGARPVLAWPNREPGAELALPFALANGGRFAVRLTAARGPGCGAYDVVIDDAVVAHVDLRAAEDAAADLSLGVHELAPGPHRLAFRAIAAGKVAVETLRLLPLPAEAAGTRRTRDEAQFVRLAIGRAVFAHRLAFGAVPDSLQALVDAGFLAARYLRDEHGLPLKCWRDGDSIVVESPGEDRWRRSWQGLDARR